MCVNVYVCARVCTCCDLSESLFDLGLMLPPPLIRTSRLVFSSSSLGLCVCACVVVSVCVLLCE